MKFDGQVTGLDTAVRDERYQAELEKRTNDILKGRSEISVKELKNSTIFKGVYEQLSDTGKSNFDEIIKKDTDASTVSEKELKTLLTFYDAHLETVNGRERFVLDHNYENLDSFNGFNQATPKEIHDIYNDQTAKTKSKGELKAEEVAKQKAEAEKFQMQAKTKEIVGNYQNIDFDKYKQQKIDTEFFKAMSGWDPFVENYLKENNIEFTKTEDGKFEYEINGMKYVSYNTKDKDLGMEIRKTDIYPKGSDQKVQTVYYANTRGLNGVQVENFQNGKPSSNVLYAPESTEPHYIEEYRYKDGKLVQIFEQNNHNNRKYIINYNENEQVINEISLKNDIISYKIENGKKEYFSEEKLLGRE